MLTIFAFQKQFLVNNLKLFELCIIQCIQLKINVHFLYLNMIPKKKGKKLYIYIYLKQTLVFLICVDTIKLSKNCPWLGTKTPWSCLIGMKFITWGYASPIWRSLVKTKSHSCCFNLFWIIFSKHMNLLHELRNQNSPYCLLS